MVGFDSGDELRPARLPRLYRKLLKTSVHLGWWQTTRKRHVVRKRGTD
jgi:hypothetical protein